MNNILRIKSSYVIVSFFLFLTSCNGQNKYYSEYNIGVIPNIARFEIMTQNEIRNDTLKLKAHNRSLQSMLDGTAFIKGISEKNKQESIEYEKNKYQRYKDNRSRYYMNLFINDKIDHKYLQGVDTLTTECSCYLSGDTIRVKMGIWVFGGFTFSVELTKKKFNSTYWEDTHEQSIYKVDLKDSNLVDNVLVENQEQFLVLDKQPTFLIDDSILGYLTFKTKNYYREKNFGRIGAEEDENRGQFMDTLNLAGSLYFKCKVRKKIIGDE